MMDKITIAKQEVSRMLDEGIDENSIDSWLSDNGLTPEDLRASDADYSAGDVLRAGFGGLSFNTGDELEAGIRAPFSDRSYRDIRDEIRGEMDQFSANHPIKAIGAELVGGGLTGGLGVGRALAKKGIEFGAKNLMKIGAAEGAVAGAGTADEMSDVPLGVGVGLGIGAGLGGLTGIGANFIRNYVKGSPKTQAGRQILERLQADNITPDEAIAELRRLGDDAILADISPNMQGLARAASNQPGASRKAAIDVLDRRQSGQQARLVQESERVSGMKGDPLNAIDNLTEVRKEQADLLYSKARAIPVDVTDNMLNEARLNPLPTRKAIEWFQRDTGNIVDPEELGNVTDLRFWDYWKQGMDDQISAASRSGAKNEARILRNSKNKALSDFDSDAYSKARTAYKVPTKMIEAMQRGKKIFSNEYAEDMSREISKMSKDERNSFVVGALRELRERINRGPESAGNARNLIKSPGFREKLRNAFPDDDSYKKFIDTVEREAQMTETRNIVHPNLNSKTAGVMADQASASKYIDPIMDLFSGNPTQALTGAARNMTGRSNLLTDPVNNELARLLFTQGSRANNDALTNALRAGTMNRLLPPASIGALNMLPHQLYGE